VLDLGSHSDEVLLRDWHSPEAKYRQFVRKSVGKTLWPILFACLQGQRSVASNAIHVATFTAIETVCWMMSMPALLVDPYLTKRLYEYQLLYKVKSALRIQAVARLARSVSNTTAQIMPRGKAEVPSSNRDLVSLLDLFFLLLCRTLS
jgi:hypothetical protein